MKTDADTFGDDWRVGREWKGRLGMICRDMMVSALQRPDVVALSTYHIIARADELAKVRQCIINDGEEIHH